MALNKRIITTQVNNAFRLLGDLGENIIFNNVQASSYNFDTGETEQIESLSQTIRGVVFKQYAASGDNPKIKMEVLIKSEDINSNELDNYDNVNLRSKNWVIDEFEDNGFAINLKLSRKD